MRFEGQTITAEPSVSSSFTFQAQRAGDVSKSPAEGSDDSQTTTIVVVVIICAVVLIALLVFFVVCITLTCRTHKKLIVFNYSVNFNYNFFFIN